MALGHVMRNNVMRNHAHRSRSRPYRLSRLLEGAIRGNREEIKKESKRVRVFAFRRSADGENGEERRSEMRVKMYSFHYSSTR